ncbi:MAG: extracellular solute-binding protein [Clostridiaceae bacterium]|nr:extracellular solute-binding protein [Clostridiaceae bacterium]
MKRKILDIYRFFSIIIVFVTLLSSCRYLGVNESGAAKVKLSKNDFSLISNPENNLFYTSRELKFNYEFECEYPIMRLITVCGKHLAVLVSGMDDEYNLYQWVYYFNEDGQEAGHYNLENAINQRGIIVSRITGFINGEFAVCSENEASAVVYFLDQQGNQTRNPLMVIYEKENISYMTGLIGLSNGDLALTGSCPEGSKLIVYDSEMKQRFNLTHEENVEGVLESGTKRYITYRGKSEKEEEIRWLEEIDWETGESVRTIDLTGLYSSGNLFGNNGSIFVSSQSEISMIDIEKKEIKTLLNWGQTDVDRSVYSNISPIIVLSEGTIFLLGMNHGEFMDNSVLMLKQQSGNPFEGVTTLTLGGFDISVCDYLQKTVAQFNQSSDSVRIQIMDYYEGINYGLEWDEVLIDQQKAQQQMYLDVLSGKGPDILYSTGGINSFAQYERNNLLIDLYPIIQTDSSFDMGNLIPNVVSACERDGRLCKLVPHFSLTGIYGHPNIIQDRQRWTIDEFNQTVSESTSGARVFANWTPEELLQGNLGGCLNNFVDYSCNNADFDSPEFYQVLEWAKNYGQPIQISPDGRVYEDEWGLFNQNQLMFVAQIEGNRTNDLYPVFILDYGASYIGYPSPGCYNPYIVPEEFVAISAWSKNPESSWEFIKYLLSFDYQFDYSATGYLMKNVGLGYPISKQALDEWCSFELNPELQPEDPDAPMGDESIEETEEPLIDADQTKAETQIRLNICLDLIFSADSLYYPDTEIMSIIMEEAAYYFADEKSVEDVAEIIQDRVQTLLNE